MRFGEYLAALPDDEAVRLVNAVTAAAGCARHAVRLMDENASACAVLDLWARAGAELLVARRLLNGQPPIAPAADDPSPAAEWRWRFALRAEGGPAAAAVLTFLATTVAQLRAAGAEMFDDGDLTAVRLHLVGAAAALADARRLIVPMG